MSRQSISAIEAGRASPSVDVALALAQALGTTVEELFGAAREPETIETVPAWPSHSTRVAVAFVGNRWRSYGLEGPGLARAADGVARRGKAGKGLRVAPLRDPRELRDNVVMMGCAAGLGVLADRLNAARGPGRFIWFSRSSSMSLQDLGGGAAHIAGAHLVDARTGEASVSELRRLSGGVAAVVVALARWEAGLLLAAGNPLGVRSFADLARPKLRFVAREKGSGARRVTDRELERAGLPASIATKAILTAAGHMEVAAAIAQGAADTGVATRDTAIAFGLDFIPLAEERYDLVIRREDHDDPRIIRLLDTITSAPFRNELSALGYDAGPAGERVAELAAS